MQKSNGLQDPLLLYMDYAINNIISPLISEIDTEIPKSINNSIELGKKKKLTITKSKSDPHLKEEIGKIFKQTTKKFNLLTLKAKENLGYFYTDNNLIEVAHQPKYLGGERFELNKIACGGAIHQYFAKSTPFFFIGDYDQIQSELTRVHFPLINSQSGFVVGIDKETENRYFGSCIEDLPLPDFSYL